MIVDLDEKDLKSGILGLVVALVEIIKETLRRQALRRMESGSLTETEIERLGNALMELDAAIEKIKLETGIAESVKAVRDGLDKVVDEVLDTMLNPERWAHEAQQVR
jgi:hypothetical protein